MESVWLNIGIWKEFWFGGKIGCKILGIIGNLLGRIELSEEDMQYFSLFNVYTFKVSNDYWLITLGLDHLLKIKNLRIKHNEIASI